MTKTLMLAVMLSGCSYLTSLSQPRQQQQQPSNPEVGFEKRDAAHGYPDRPAQEAEPLPDDVVAIIQAGAKTDAEVAGDPDRTKLRDAYKENLEYLKRKLKQNPNDWSLQNDIRDQKHMYDAEDELYAAHLGKDKTDLWKTNWGEMYGVNQDTLTPATFKNVQVAFSLRQRDGEWVLHRYTFNGEHLAKETTEGFEHQPGPQHYK